MLVNIEVRNDLSSYIKKDKKYMENEKLISKKDFNKNKNAN